MSKMGLKSVIVTLLIGLIGCNRAQKENKSIVGLWSLQSMQVKDTLNTTWSDFRGGMQGYLLYDGQKNMTIHLSDKDFNNTELKFPNFNEDIPIQALKHLTKTYYYVGEYEVLNDSIVQHTRLSHSNPGDWGKVVQRHYSFKGDTLVITPTESKNANLRLKWLKED